MRKRALRSLVLLITSLAVMLTALVACTPTNVVKPNNPSVNKQDDENKTVDGFTKGTATVDEVCQDLIKTILNSAYTAGKDRLTTSNPYVSWWIDVDCDINGNKGTLSFKINFDVRDPESMTVRLALLPDGYKKESLEFVFFADTPSADGKKHPGSLYLRVGDSKMIVPFADSFLSDMFPLDTYKSDDLISFIAGRLATINKISYEYKDEIGDKRTRRYGVQVDVKQTIINVLNLLNNASTKNEYDSVKWIVENAFGISIANISTEMPTTHLSVNFTTEGGMRTAYGTGSLKELKLCVEADANGKINTIFKGEKFDGKFELKKFSALRKLISMPTRESLDKDGYLLYNSRTVSMNAKLVYVDTPETEYDFNVSFLYTGIEDYGADDLFMTRISSKDGDLASIYYKENVLYVNMLDRKTGLERNLQCEFDLDRFIAGVEENIGGRDEMDVLKAMTYVIGSLQFSDNATKMSYIFDERFFNGVLNLDLDALYDLLNEAYKSAGGIGFVHDRFAEAGINLGDVVYDRTLTVTIDFLNEDTITIGDEKPQIPTAPDELASLKKN